MVYVRNFLKKKKKRKENSHLSQRLRLFVRSIKTYAHVISVLSIISSAMKETVSEIYFAMDPLSHMVRA